MKLTQPEVDAPVIEWALYWACHGWKVFPLCSPDMGEHKHTGNVCEKDIGKHPMVGQGFHAGTVETSQIRTWWTKWPSANVGATPPPGWVAVDIDGDTQLEFTPTREHSSGKGRHLIYADPKGAVPHGNKIWDNIDTRANGKGYIVLPPSLHKSGNRYAITNDHDVDVFPYGLLAFKRSADSTVRREGGKPKANPLVDLLLMPVDDPDTGDDWLTRIAGFIAHRAKDRTEFEAWLWRFNMSLSEPLDDPALRKKYGVWESEQRKPERVADEERGWLLEAGHAGYSTQIGKGDNLEIVPWSDFRVQAKGLIIYPDRQVWIIDFHRANGETLENVKLPSEVIASTSRLRAWLVNRGMSLFVYANDTRTSHGERLLKLLQSQKPPVLEARDHYGWCPESEAFLIDVGEVTSQGLRSFTSVYPDDALIENAPVRYGFDVDLTQTRTWFNRVMALQDEVETAKLGAWLMMLMLRRQWKGLLPGLLVEAFAGTGKTTFFKLFTALSGVPQDGENMTAATARDMLAAHPSGFIWLDDVATDAKMEQLVRKAITEGREVLKTNADGAGWKSTHRQLRGSVIVSGEGVEFYRQKAYRDRFLNVEFKPCPTPDADRLIREDIGRGAGTLLAEVLRHAGMLPALESLREGITSREKQGQATLRIGARILDVVMSSGTHYTDLVDGWCLNGAVTSDLGQASECVLQVFPSLWTELNYPMAAGANGVILPIWYDEVDEVFWINGKRCAEAWNNRRNVGTRQRQLTSQTAIGRELDACEASKTKSKRTGFSGEGAVVGYRQLPQRYSAMVKRLATDHRE